MAPRFLIGLALAALALGGCAEDKTAGEQLDEAIDEAEDAADDAADAVEDAADDVEDALKDG